MMRPFTCKALVFDTGLTSLPKKSLIIGVPGKELRKVFATFIDNRSKALS